MSQIIIVAEKTNTGYSAYLEGIDGIAAVGENLTELRSNMQEAIRLHVETLKEFGDSVPEKLIGDHILKIKLDTIAFFQWLSEVMTQKGLAQIAGINKSLLSQYATGIKKPSEKQLKKIEDALHKFAEDLKAISFS